MKRDMLIAAVMTAAGVLVSGVSIAEINREQHQHVAQATPPTQSTPGAESKPSDPATTTTGTGARPHDIAPEPARPDADAQKSGAQPVLPPAPAEKTAAPVGTK